MGSSNSIMDKYHAGLRMVAGRTKWRVGLIINIEGLRPLIVYDIIPLERDKTAPELAALISQAARSIGYFETYYVYQYTGDQVKIDDRIATKVGKYAILLKTITDAKIGGRAPPKRVGSANQSTVQPQTQPQSTITAAAEVVNMAEYACPNFTKTKE